MDIEQGLIPDQVVDPQGEINPVAGTAASEEEKRSLWARAADATKEEDAAFF